MREKVQIFVEKCRDTAVLPRYAHPDDAGMDIYAAETVELAPGQTALVPTGLKMAIPDGFELQVRPRSGLSLKTALRVPNSPGTVDAGFRNEICVIVWNASDRETITVNRGDRIAQFVLARVPMAEFTFVDNVSSIGTDRGGGFGSSGTRDINTPGDANTSGGTSDGNTPRSTSCDAVPAACSSGTNHTEYAIGEDSHAFERTCDPARPLVLGGVRLDVPLTLKANSDGDVLLHALTNALSGLTGRNILGAPADALCREGVTDSAEYLKLALTDLERAGFRLTRVSFSIEAKKPRFAPLIPEIRAKIAELCGLTPEQVGLTATSGEDLTAFGRGRGIRVLCAVTAERR